MNVKKTVEIDSFCRRIEGKSKGKKNDLRLIVPINSFTYMHLIKYMELVSMIY